MDGRLRYGGFEAGPGRGLAGTDGELGFQVFAGFEGAGADDDSVGRASEALSMGVLQMGQKRRCMILPLSAVET